MTLEEKLRGKRWREVELEGLFEDGDLAVAFARGRGGTYCPAVDFSARAYFCSCPGHRIRGGVCKHIAALLVHLRGRRREEELEEVLLWPRTPGA